MEFFVICKGKLTKHLSLNPGYVEKFQKLWCKDSSQSSSSIERKEFFE